YALVAFGGAGAQHACAVASRLGIRRVLVPEDAGLLSAAGLAAAVVERFAERQVLLPLAEVRDQIGPLLDELGKAARAAGGKRWGRRGSRPGRSPSAGGS